MSEEEKQPEEQINEEEEKEEEEKEEPELDSQGNPISPEDLAKGPRHPLKFEVLKTCLKKLSKTFDGLSYAFTALDIHEKELDDLGQDINKFTQLRNINASNNKLKEMSPLINMPYLSIVDFSINALKDMSIFSNTEAFQYLQVLNLKQNKIKTLPEMHARYLKELNLSENKIVSCAEFKGLPKLVKLNLSQNKLKSCEGLANCPELDVLYLNQNRLTSFEGIKYKYFCVPSR